MSFAEHFLASAVLALQRAAQALFSIFDPVSPVQQCPHDKAGTDDCDPEAKIVSIGIVEGGKEGAEKLVGSAEQYVNLPRDADYVDGKVVKDKDRLGLYPRFKVEFDRPGRHIFFAELMPVSADEEYSATEKSRNYRFTHSDTTSSYLTSRDGTEVFDDFRLVAGGGFKFRVRAYDENGNTVKSGIIETKRMVYYCQAKMKGLSSIASSTSSLEGEYDRHHIKLLELNDVEIPRQQNIGSSSDSSTFNSNCRKAVNGDAACKKVKKHMLVLGYTDHLAVKNSSVVLRSLPGLTIGPKSTAQTLSVSAAGLRPPNSVATRALWQNLVSGESWFVSAKVKYSDGTIKTIPESDVTPQGSGSYQNSLSVDTSSLPKGKGQIEVVVNVVDRMRAGLAMGGANLTCVCTRAWWRTINTTDQMAVAIHEFGHKFNQVADGKGTNTDKSANQYDNKGHVGSHCHTGCASGQTTYATSANNKSSTCVMFGSTNGHSKFCSNCSPGVKKTDICDGW